MKTKDLELDLNCPDANRLLLNVRLDSKSMDEAGQKLDAHVRGCAQCTALNNERELARAAKVQA
jgi:hypothetical protein